MARKALEAPGLASLDCAAVGGRFSLKNMEDEDQLLRLSLAYAQLP